MNLLGPLSHVLGCTRAAMLGTGGGGVPGVMVRYRHIRPVGGPRGMGPGVPSTHSLGNHFLTVLIKVVRKVDKCYSPRADVSVQKIDNKPQSGPT